MNMKHIFLFFLLFGAGMATAGCGECFSGKSLEELEVMYKKQMEEVNTTFAAKQLEVAWAEHFENQARLGTATINCGIFKDHAYAAYLIGATQNDCDLVQQYRTEYRKSEALKEFAQEELNTIKTLELKELERCIMARQAKQILEKSGLLK